MANVAYTANGNWKPTIPNQTCAHCGVIYTAHRKGQRFCSKACSGLARGAEIAAKMHTSRTCPGCGVVWSGPPSNQSLYCSKTCIFESGKWAKPVTKECRECGAAFTVSPRRTGNYCSRSCARTGSLGERIAKICAQCGDEFVVSPTRADETTCSQSCRDAYFLRDRHHAWKGGAVLQGERQFRRIDREGYQAKYEGEHRLIAAREIGRQIMRGEVVLCIDGNNDNLAPSNLFLLPNQTEFGLIRSGAVEWPTSSNLAHYKVNGYQRPDVRVFLHEWENGQRRVSDRGKPITRHPQADEIIKRRRAGATAKQLAEAFNTNLSNMAHILRHRL